MYYKHQHKLYFLSYYYKQALSIYGSTSLMNINVNLYLDYIFYIKTLESILPMLFWKKKVDYDLETSPGTNRLYPASQRPPWCPLKSSLQIQFLKKLLVSPITSMPLCTSGYSLPGRLTVQCTGSTARLDYSWVPEAEFYSVAQASLGLYSPG